MVLVVSDDADPESEDDGGGGGEVSSPWKGNLRLKLYIIKLYIIYLH